MPPKSNKKIYKKRILKSKEHYSLPEKIVRSIRELQNLQNVLQTVDSVKTNWQEEKETFVGSPCLKTMLDRNMLTCAAWYGHAAVIDFIISKWMTQQQCRKDPSCKWAKNDHLDHVLSLPMFIAAYRKHSTIVEMLVKHVTKITGVISKKKLESLPYWNLDHVIFPDGLKHFTEISTLEMIIYTDNLDLLKALEIQQVNINWKVCLYRTCMFKAESCAEYMLNNVDELKEVASLKYICERKNVFTPLMIASQTSYKITKMLLERGVNVNANDGSNRNSLHFAVAPFYLHEEVHTGTYDGKVKKIDRPSAVYIGNDKKLDFHSRGNPQYRCLSIGEETVKIVKLLLEYGIDKTIVGGNTLNEHVKVMAFHKLNSNLDPVQFGDENTLSPLGVLLYQIPAMSLCAGKYITRKLSSQKEVENHYTIIDQLITCLFVENDIQKCFAAWYYATLYSILNSSCFLRVSSCEEQEEMLKDLAIGHDVLNISLKYLLWSLAKLLNVTNPNKMCPLNDFGVSWLIVRMVPLIKVCIMHGIQKTTNCAAMECMKKMALDKVPMHKQILCEILKLYYAYGFSLADNLEELRYISKIAHKEESVYFVPEVLSLLCTLSHHDFYNAVAILEEIPPRVCNTDDSYWNSEEEEDEPAEPDDFVNHRCMYSEIRALNLEENPRPLAHISRLALYECLGRQFKPGVMFSTSKTIQEYITSFVY